MVRRRVLTRQPPPLHTVCCAPQGMATTYIPSWTASQMIERCGYQCQPRYLMKHYPWGGDTKRRACHWDPDLCRIPCIFLPYIGAGGRSQNSQIQETTSTISAEECLSCQSSVGSSMPVGEQKIYSMYHLETETYT